MLPWTCPNKPNDLIGKVVKGTLWGYVPDCTGEDVDKDIIGEFIGTVEGVTSYNPAWLRIKLELFRDNIGGAKWTPDFSNARTCMGPARHMEDGYLEEGYYNVDLLWQEGR